MSLRRPLLALSLLAAGCATTQAAGPGPAAPAEAAPAPAPEASVQAMFQRELPGELARVPVAGPKRRFTALVEAAGEVTVKEDGEFVDVVVPIGTAQPIECIVYPERVGAGQVFHTVLSRVKEHLQVRAQRPTAVLSLREAPAVVLETVYAGQRDGQTVGGLLKMMVHVDPTLPVLCMHDEPGYAATFQRVVSGLLDSLELGEGQKGRARARYSELHVLRVGQQPVGFDWRAVYEGGQGGRVDENVSSLFMPTSPTEVTFSDSRALSVLDGRGQLIEAVHEEVNNGEQEMALSLERGRVGAKGGTRYGYEGVHSGKKVKGTFTAPRGLTTETAMVEQVRRKLKGDKAGQLAFDIYSPDADPAAPVPVVYRRDGKTPAALTVQVAAMTFTGTTDAQGLLERYALPIGSVKLEAERLHVRGTP